ncbi:hypothetical protein MNB_SV-3-669 [hydrothermal vent metagenome]|uniref:Plasminogen-binding protein PgbA N-terminal domain-containing protein n=1 Tax=hydrothermal vent metagenome TaxID=652676 RepID=A0A1W1CKV1_9ZZZZ
MFKIVFLTLLSLPLFAGFFPQSVHTSIKSINGSSVILNTKFPANGISGVVVHNYGNGLTAITSRIVQTASDGTASLLSDDIIHHNQLPTINTPVKVGDEVIGGYLYRNVLLLAPDADTYSAIVKANHKKWIHPDLFALYLMTEGEESVTKENLADFAKKYQVGLIYIVRKNSAILFDPISQKIISQKKVSNLPPKGQYPFYMHFDKLESGWFSSQSEENYYDMAGAF